MKNRAACYSAMGFIVVLMIVIFFSCAKGEWPSPTGSPPQKYDLGENTISTMINTENTTSDSDQLPTSNNKGTETDTECGTTK